MNWLMTKVKAANGTVEKITKKVLAQKKVETEAVVYQSQNDYDPA